MPWTTPTLQETRKLARDYIAAYLPGADATIPNSVLRVLADSNAGLAHLTLLYLDWLARQFLPDTAEKEWLDRFGDIWGVPRRAATFAEGEVLATGVTGTEVPAFTPLTAGGMTYETQAAATLSSTGANIPVRALTAGKAGNRDEGDSMAFAGGVGGLDGIATILEMSGGFDAEDDETLRARVLDRIRQPPMGGDANDYVQWAEQVDGVEKAWQYAQEMGIGTITVRFLMGKDVRPPYGIPLTQDLDAVRAYVDSKRPVTVKDFFVEAPIAQPISVTITNLSKDDEATRGTIEEALVAMFEAKMSPGQTTFRSWVDEAISAALGEASHELMFTTTPALSGGHLPVLGNITYA